MSTSGGGCGSLDKATKAYIYELQAPATLNQGAPGQFVWYDVIPTTANVRVYTLGVAIEDTNETLRWQYIIDGVTSNPVNFGADHSINHYAVIRPDAIDRTIDTALETSADNTHRRAFLIEGKSVRIQVGKTTVAGVGNLVAVASYGVLAAI